MMDAKSIVESWQDRLKALADNPAYVFRDTSQRLIDRHYQRLTTFVGFPESEVAVAEERLGGKFPDIFRQYLLQMGKSPGDLFRGSHLAALDELQQYREDALELLEDMDFEPDLPENAVVFLDHQGYTFVFLLAAGGSDGPVMQWTETKMEPNLAAETFAEFVDAELRLMEENNRMSRKNGGYYLTLFPGGGGKMSYP